MFVTPGGNQYLTITEKQFQELCILIDERDEPFGVEDVYELSTIVDILSDNADVFAPDERIKVNCDLVLNPKYKISKIIYSNKILFFYFKSEIVPTPWSLKTVLGFDHLYTIDVQVLEEGE